MRISHLIFVSGSSSAPLTVSVGADDEYLRARLWMDTGDGPNSAFYAGAGGASGAGTVSFQRTHSVSSLMLPSGGTPLAAPSSAAASSAASPVMSPMRAALPTAGTGGLTKRTRQDSSLHLKLMAGGDDAQSQSQAHAQTPSSIVEEPIEPPFAAHEFDSAATAASAQRLHHSALAAPLSHGGGDSPLQTSASASVPTSLPSSASFAAMPLVPSSSSLAGLVGADSAAVAAGSASDARLGVMALFHSFDAVQRAFAAVLAEFPVASTFGGTCVSDARAVIATRNWACWTEKKWNPNIFLGRVLEAFCFTMFAPEN